MPVPSYTSLSGRLFKKNSSLSQPSDKDNMDTNSTTQPSLCTDNCLT